ncbi:hypothetical protein [Agromyces mangrovi Wang et al. 2018]|uniref:hypothetical protein n=1 Tax=Agromyces mangrovi TaxID=1858653 RepID=UPI002572A582|nr:hypothetical protein [Agromyces mangrovi]BDZ64777.1 hypothetical protein GCM10025877_17150 [Agromyces mangrovi]
MSTARPFGVTLVAILAWLTGLFQIIPGVIALFGGDLTYAIVAILVGLITIFVSLGLFRGSNGARIVVTIVFVLNIAASLYVVFAIDGGFWTAIWSILFPAIGLILLYTSKANAFFR